MKKILAAVLFILLAANVTEAKPAHWYKDWRNWAALGLSVGSSAAASYAVSGCRSRADLVHCDNGYGSFRASQGLRGGLSFTLGTMSVVGHEKGFKEWLAPALGVTAYNTYTAIQQSRVPTSNDKKIILK